MRNLWWAVPGLAAGAVVLAACGTSSPTNTPTDPPPSSPATSATGHTSAANSVAIKMMSTSKGTVLATASGLTLYWFAKDTMTTSHCTGSCASYWPPLLGKPIAAAGTSLPHGFGTIKRAGGQTQATYDGHPLYTYAGDTAAGQVAGNDVDASGGLWWAATPSGSELKPSAPASKPHPAASSSSSSSGSGGW
jgi:predicted lipoprotein with Yx(FWY)xxD motif